MLNIKMRYSIEPRDRVYVKGYGFMSFARSMSNKYGKKLVDTAKKSVFLKNLLKNYLLLMKM